MDEVKKCKDERAERCNEMGENGMDVLCKKVEGKEEKPEEVNRMLAVKLEALANLVSAMLDGRFGSGEPEVKMSRENFVKMATETDVLRGENGLLKEEIVELKEKVAYFRHGGEDRLRLYEIMGGEVKKIKEEKSRWKSAAKSEEVIIEKLGILFREIEKVLEKDSTNSNRIGELMNRAKMITGPPVLSKEDIGAALKQGARERDAVESIAQSQSIDPNLRF